MLTERIKQWGKERGVDVEVVMINQNETVQKVSAAIEAGNMPDAFDVGRDFLILLSRSNRLEPIDDLYAKIGKAHGGWLDSADKASDPKLLRWQALWRPIRHVGQSDQSPGRSVECGGLQGRASDLGGVVEAS